MRGILVAAMAVLLGAAVIGVHGTQGGISVDGPRGAIRVASGAAGAADAGLPPSPLLSAAFTSSGVSRLSSSITLNSVTESAFIDCDGNTATASAIDCGSAGSLSAAGTPTVDVKQPFTDGREGFTIPYGSSAGYDAPSSTGGDIGTEDFVFEWIGKLRNETGTTVMNATIARKRIAPDYEGYQFDFRNGSGDTNRFLFAIDTGPTHVSCYSGNNAANQWTHVIVCADRNEADQFQGLTFYVNGTNSSTSCSISSYSGSLASTASLAIGNTDPPVSTVDVPVYGRLRAWKRNSWLPGGAANVTQCEALAKSRFATLTGSDESVASAAPTFTRSSTATLSMYDTATSVTTLHTVGTGWPRVERSAAGSGFLGEAAATNLVLQSNDLSTTWLNSNTTETLNTDVCPDGQTTADTLTATAGAGWHTIYQNIVLTEAAHTHSVYVKAGTANYVWNDSGANGAQSGSCDLTTGATYIAAGSPALRCTSMGGGWWRFENVSTATAGTKTWSIGVCTSSSTCNYSAAGTETIKVCGAQVETGTRATSKIDTTTAQVTRAADSLRYDYTGTATGTLLATVLCPSSDYTGTTAGLVSLSDGTAANRIALLPVASGDVGRLLVTAASTDTADITGATDIFDGVSRELRGTWSATSVKLYVGGASEGTEDTSATIPSTTYLYLGSSTGVPSGCLLSSVQVYDEVVTP